MPRRGNDRELQAAAALHVDLIPGTDVMRDVEQIHFSHLQGSNIVLTPQPSADLKDPLNWSKKWKCLVISIQFIYTFITVESALSIAPMYPLLNADFGLSEQQVGLLTGVCVLALGFANFVIVPCSNIFGRRLASIVFAVLVVGSSIWEAVATSYSSLLAARVINGAATATNESVMVQVVADVFFLHERGLWTGVYFTSYFLGLFIGPVISGNIAQIHGWRSFFWLATGLGGFSLVILIFLFPETKYRRASPVINVSSSAETSNKGDLGTYDLDAHKKELSELEEGAPLGQTPTVDISVIGKGKPGKSNFKLIRRPDPRWRTLLARDIISPFRVFFYPIIFWAGLMVAGPANLLLFWNLTESTILGAPPYNFNSSLVGYANFAFVVGGLAGLVTAGPLSDWTANRATRRNDGIREAEMRLPALIPYGILTGVGIVVGGLGYQNLWPWEVILIVGYGLTGLAVTTIPTIAVAYAIDCYKPISGEIMVVATVLKNTCGFAMSYWVTPLAERKGYITPAMVQLALTIGPVVLAIPLYFYGKKLRKLTATSDLHTLEEQM
ncbi:hypothetical protein G7Y89_g14390 [Cudoniella acicularis]|uniref:Major facilitator superfamily (MFS) profile domain-containing protein n=1 Tax=Cudoniella acicularis TaxID=354080 RepID=A0A8H4R437_9HELO|nr:hypothetical protein G7Y89_g14390 [Cudoniella acicularis]